VVDDDVPACVPRLDMPDRLSRLAQRVPAVDQHLLQVGDDDMGEFEFGLDLVPGGLERMLGRAWRRSSSAPHTVMATFPRACPVPT
jgi:hypothetical protein